MKYFKNKKTGKIHAFEIDGSQDKLITKDFVPTKKPELKRDYKNLRKALYDNGDYIDSLMKDANLRRLAGENLHEDLDKSLGHWLGVKKKVPKNKPKGAK